MKMRLSDLTIDKSAFFVEDMRDDKKNVIVEKSFQFAVQIIEFTDLLKEQKRYSLSNQLFKLKAC